MLWRHLPLAGTVLIVVIACCLRPWLQYRRYGTHGVLLFRSGIRSQNVRDALLLVLVRLLIGQAVAATGWREPPLLIAAGGALGDVLQAAGAVLLLAGIVLLAAAQLNMGPSWRIGVKEGEAPGLVTTGLHGFCRHPIYLGLLTAIVGYTSLLPTRLSLSLLAAAYVGARVQAAAEEAHLQRTYGETYCHYAHRVGRFLPRIGRL
jgi:protein-S-isoprenylcysteine O-methyltransferase Ste14